MEIWHEFIIVLTDMKQSDEAFNASSLQFCRRKRFITSVFTQRLTLHWCYFFKENLFLMLHRCYFKKKNSLSTGNPSSPLLFKVTLPTSAYICMVATSQAHLHTLPLGDNCYKD
jgi:hypothetical protein